VGSQLARWRAAPAVLAADLGSELASEADVTFDFTVGRVSLAQSKAD
jgi:hypothetical protein